MVEPDFKKSGGLVPAIVQDDVTKEVLMLAYMNELSWRKTLETGKATYWSRSRNELWVKGGATETFRGSRRSGSTATTTRSCSWWTRSARRPVTRDTARAFTGRFPGGREEIVGELIFNPKDVYK